MTLNAKLSLSVGLAVALSIVVTLFLTWQRVSKFVISSEKDHFTTVAIALEDNLESSYREYLAAKVSVVLDTKRQMRSMLLDIRNDLHALSSILPDSELQEKLKKLLLSNHNNDSVYVVPENFSVALTTKTDLSRAGFPALKIEAQARNTKQQTLEKMLATLPLEGEFALWLTDDRPVLLFILPMASDSENVLVAGLRLALMFKKADALLANRLEAIKQNFQLIPFYAQGLFLICDDKGKILVQRGDATPLQEHLDELFKRAYSQDNIRGRINAESGEYLYHIAWIDTYNWYFCMAVPLDVLYTPLSTLLRLLCVVGVAILVLATTFTVFMVRRALLPLLRLRDCTVELATVDPSSSASLEAFETKIAQRLNLKRHDELGDLARSFASMGRELVKNIRTSMANMSVQKRMEGELNAAKEIQMGILPDLKATQPEPGFAVSAFLEPAREVGGDLYDSFTLTDGRKALVVGDVSDKGVPAALFMAMTVTLVRCSLRSGLDPAQALAQVNTLLEEHNPGNMFVTLFVALYTPETGELVYANGGHCLPYIVDAHDHLRQLEHLSGPLVGAMPDLEYIQFKDVLAPGDICFFYTDGLTEALNTDKKLYGEERLAACLLAARKTISTPSALQEAVFADICAFRGQEPPSDDITMMTVCRPALTEGEVA